MRDRSHELAKLRAKPPGKPPGTGFRDIDTYAPTYKNPQMPFLPLGDDLRRTWPKVQKMSARQPII